MFLWHDGHMHETACTAGSEDILQDGYWRTEQAAREFLNQWEENYKD